VAHTTVRQRERRDTSAKWGKKFPLGRKRGSLFTDHKIQTSPLKGQARKGGGTLTQVDHYHFWRGEGGEGPDSTILDPIRKEGGGSSAVLSVQGGGIVQDLRTGEAGDTQKVVPKDRVGMRGEEKGLLLLLLKKGGKKGGEWPPIFLGECLRSEKKGKREVSWPLPPFWHRGGKGGKRGK